ncbi:hypothetical protein EYF80_032634 [Liparis tanakae]|uniref:Uncharacterized protein n=1 Tax=Liparis tanakae TaxID=230148 RepID=A0A4Z2GUT8_9TELE|nr:hypothetical protein EYF80_032634 [Liparis tanakae]
MDHRNCGSQKQETDDNFVHMRCMVFGPTPLESGANPHKAPSIQVPLTGKFHDWIWTNAFPPLLLSTCTAYLIVLVFHPKDSDHLDFKPQKRAAIRGKKANSNQPCTTRPATARTNQHPPPTARINQHQTARTNQHPPPTARTNQHPPPNSQNQPAPTTNSQNQPAPTARTNHHQHPEPTSTNSQNQPAATTNSQNQPAATTNSQ